MTAAFVIIAAAAALHRPAPVPAHGTGPGRGVEAARSAAKSALPRPPRPAPARDAADGWAGPEAASAKAAKRDVRLGEPFDVAVEIDHAPGESWGLAPQQKLDPFALVSQGPVTTAPGKGPIEVTRLDVKLALFKLDQHSVPALQLVARDARGATHTFSLPGPTVKGIAPDLAKDHEKRDIHAPVPVLVTNYRPLWLALGLLALLALAVWTWLWWRRRPRRERTASRAPELPADQAALAALAKLEEEGLPAAGRFKEFHLRLSLVLRGYLGSRYAFHALDMTSTELLDALGRLRTDGLKLADISWICLQGDMAKFAKGQPSADDCKEALSLVRQTVIRTRALPSAAPGAQAGAAA